MRDISDDLKALRGRIAEAEDYLHLEDKRALRPQLETEASRPDLWDDQAAAQQLTTELKNLTDDIEMIDGLVERVDDAETLADLAREEGDDSVEAEVEALLAGLVRQLDDIELRALFTGEYDDHDAICAIQAGEGGADAQDWAEALLRMYLRWAERRGLEAQVTEATEGSEAGLSSATFIVKGRYAYGQLKAEKGTHRLVRISPFNAQGKRQTAFAALDVVPLLDEAETNVEVDDRDIKMDVYRASGAGGQHINKTSSAVRLTHLPTGIVVACQNERSQFQNRDRAMAMLKARLADLERQQREDEIDAIRGEKQRVGFGTQIRSYVLHPYQMVKDLRSGHETGNVDAVLDGDLDPFIEAQLRWERAGGEPVADDDG